MSLFIEYIQQKNDEIIVLESDTIDNNTKKNIKNCLENGYTLIILDFDELLLDLVLPIIEWRYNFLKFHIFNKYIKKIDIFQDLKDNFTNDNKKEFNKKDNRYYIKEKIFKQFKLNFFDEEIFVNKKFNLILATRNENKYINPSLLSKVLIK